MGSYSRQEGRAMRPEDVNGSLNLGTAREAALVVGIRVVGVRVASDDGQVDVRLRPQREARRAVGARFDLRRLFGRPRVEPPRPAWANHPDDLPSYPAEWEASLRRFVLAFEHEEARESAGLSALRLPVPMRVGFFAIEAVGVDGWIAQFGRYGFSSLDLTPPSFEIPPGVEYPVSRSEPHAGGRAESVPRAHVSIITRRVGEAADPGTRQLHLNRDPYAFYRLMNDGTYVYHLRESGLDADFDRYWIAKFEPLVCEPAA